MKSGSADPRAPVHGFKPLPKSAAKKEAPPPDKGKKLPSNPRKGK